MSTLLIHQKEQNMTKKVTKQIEVELNVQESPELLEAVAEELKQEEPEDFEETIARLIKREEDDEDTERNV